MEEKNKKISEEETFLLFSAVDQDNSGRIDILEFLELCDVLLLKFRG